MLASAIADRLEARLIVINGPEIVTGSAGATEATIESIFKQAAEGDIPSIVFIDEIDTLCPSRDDATSGIQKRVLATLLTILDGYWQSISELSLLVLQTEGRARSRAATRWSL